MDKLQELEARIKELEKRNIQNGKKLGEAIGALKAIAIISKDQELKDKINALLNTFSNE